MSMAKSSNTRGGPGRGQGRKPLHVGEPMVVVPVRLTVAQREKLRLLGGAAWLRELLDQTPSPELSVPP